MLHELLIALSGHSGSLFTVGVTSKNDVAVGIDQYIHPSEKLLLIKLLKIASLYKQIQDFYRKYGNYSSSTESEESGDLQNGLYLTAFASSLNDECCAYKKEIVVLEQELLKDPTLPLNVVLLHMDVYEPLLAVLCRLMCDIEENEIHGCKILESINLLRSSSVGNVRESLYRIEQQVYKVVIDQLTRWMLYGTLHDPHKELFVLISEKSHDPSCIVRALKQEDAIQLEVDGRSKMETFRNFEVNFRLEMLPQNIPSSIAEKIIFIGESILFFKEAQYKRICYDAEFKKKSEFSTLPSLQHLSSEDISMENFPSIIERVRLNTAEHMCELLKSSGLISELNDVKAIFLLGKGELYQSFFNLADHLLITPVSSAQNLTGLFHKAGHQVLIDDSTLDRFTIFLHKTNDEAQKEITIGWKRLRIEYKVDWPMHQIFGEKMQEKYNIILQFLLQLRRAQHMLQKSWIHQMSNKESRFNQLTTQVWMLRHHMSLLIYNLQCYIQVDVLESRYWELVQEINSTKDYQRLIRLHNTFVSSLIGQCFINHPMLSKTIDAILGQIISFSDTFSKEFSSLPTEELKEKIQHMWEQFDQSAGLFFNILSTLGQHNSGQQTTQLITRIDYNKYYSCKAPGTLWKFVST